MSGQKHVPPVSIAVVGIGPRGISVIERIGAELGARPRGAFTLHLIDEAQLGAGRIWETGQTRTLCMNTLAGAVTLFTEPGATVSAPVLQGPIQYEWIRLLLGEREGIEPAKLATFDAFPPDPAIAEDFAAELAQTRPESNPSRALYGAYLRWCYEVALGQLPANVTVVEHQARATSITAAGEQDLLELSDGTRLRADATVLATGWVRPGPTTEEAELTAAAAKHPQLTWVRPGNPVEQDLSAIPAEDEVLVRGLGMGFFDVMALLTIDRGGQFIDDDTARSGLRYEASGKEPHLIVTSHRGYPYLPKSHYGSLPPAAAIPRLRTVIDSLGTSQLGPASIDFDKQVWPAVVRDAYEAYYRTLYRLTPAAINGSPKDLIRAINEATPNTIDAAVAPFIPAPGNRFSLSDWEQPLAGITKPRGELTRYIGDRLVEDIREAEAAWDSPLKSALWSISASRKPAAILGAEGRYTFESRRNRFAALMAIGQMAGSGPPLFRTRQLLALVDAGLVSFLGAGSKLRVDDIVGEFVLKSRTTDEAEVYSTTLVDAWMHSPDVRRSTDPLGRSLLDAGRIRPFHNTTTDRKPLATGSPEVDPVTRLLIGADQQPDTRVHLIGIPTYGQLPDTTISPMPGTNPLMLQETDQAAQSLLQVAFG